jgi:hypothetical protein
MATFFPNSSTSTGTKLWSKTVGVSGRFTTIRGIAFTAQNDFYISGSLPHSASNAWSSPSLGVPG